jgi:hypothetical protein
MGLDKLQGTTKGPRHVNPPPLPNTYYATVLFHPVTYIPRNGRAAVRVLSPHTHSLRRRRNWRIPSLVKRIPPPFARLDHTSDASARREIE